MEIRITEVLLYLLIVLTADTLIVMFTCIAMYCAM